jgi:hypothetical protein
MHDQEAQVDAERFDSLTRVLQSVRSRRSLTTFLGSIVASGSLAALLAEEESEAKRKKGGGKRGGKRKKKTTPTTNPPPVSPPVSPPPTPPTCQSESLPEFCPGADRCVPGCPAGKEFDETTCKCVCAPARTCCYCSCQGGTNFQCFPDGIANVAACQAACGDFCDENPDTVQFSFAGGSGNDAACDFAGDICVTTCDADVCSGANTCVLSAARCNSGAHSCFQPLGGGPTRCSSPVGGSCGCTSHDDCAGGAFCVNGTGCDACSGANFCAMPR